MKNDMPHRIDIYGNVKYTNELEQTSHRFEKIKSVWASIIPQTGNLQSQQADTILTNVTHKIIIRYASAKDVTKDMHIHFKNHRFEIRYILNPYFSNETLEVFCQELID